FDNTLYERANLLTKVDRNWAKETNAYDAYRKNLQYGIDFGTGYLLEEWDKEYHNGRYGDIRLRAIDPQNVTFVQLPRDHNLQNAYIVIVREELPIMLAKRMYKGIADLIEPDREAPTESLIKKGYRRVQQFIKRGILSLGSQDKQPASYPVVD